MSTPLPRLISIGKYLKRHKYASIQKIGDHLESLDFVQSQRSIERDFKRLREDYQINIYYDRSNRGYCIAESSLGYLDDMCRMAEYFQSAEILETILHEGLDKVNVIDLDSNGELLGVEWLDELFNSITNKKNILISYQSFNYDKPFLHDLSPWLLKFYQGRWYVAGKAHNGLRIFGVDRIHDIKPSESDFEPYKGNPRDIFKNQIGIFYADGDPVEVRFLATPVHAKYLSTLKMHHSQKHLGQENGCELFSIYVTINLELTQQILLAGERLKVLSPPELVDNLKNEIKNMHQHYFDSDR